MKKKIDLSGDLKDLLLEKKGALRTINFSGSQSKDVKEISKIKKDIARILTEKRKKELAILNTK